jgi:peptidoglycan/LPS O-acetylase OafA/YrhL
MERFDSSGRTVRSPDGTLARLPALDGVRGIAILLVLTGHFIGLGGLGVAGVSLFFVLSGFLITRLLVAEVETRGRLHFGRFYWRRACRIIPAYMLWVGVTWFILGNPASAGDRSALVGLMTYTYNYVTPTAYGFNSIIHPAWSLSVEEQFYLLWPLALTLLTLAHAKRGLLLLFGAAVAWRAIAVLFLHLPQTYLDWAFETNACTLAAGCWLALYTMDGGKLWWLRFTRPRQLTILAGIALSSLCLSLPATANSAAWAVPLSALVMFLVVSIALQEGPQELLAHPLLRWIGAISYPLYLWHLWGLAIGERLPLPHWLQLLAALAACVILASASYYLLELPILRWRDLSRRDSAQPSSLEPAAP